MFNNNTAQGTTGEVAVSDANYRVYSNTPQPQVWDESLGHQITAWRLSLNDGSSDVDAFEGRVFPTETIDLFPALTAEQAAQTGMQQRELVSLPGGFDWVVSNPYHDDDFWTTRNTALVAGLGGTCVAILVSVLCWCFRFKRKAKQHPRVRFSSSVANQWCVYVCTYERIPIHDAELATSIGDVVAIMAWPLKCEPTSGHCMS